MGGRIFQVEAAFALTLFQFAKKLSNLIDRVSVCRNEVVPRQDDVKFTGVCRPLFHVKQWDVNRKEDALVVLQHSGLIRRSDEFFENDWMDIKIFVDIGNVVLGRRLKINPRESFVREGSHVYFAFYQV